MRFAASLSFVAREPHHTALSCWKGFSDMRRSAVLASFLLLLCGGPLTAASWVVRGVTYRYNPPSRSLTAQLGGVRFEPARDMGPRFLLAGKELGPGEYRVDLISARPGKQGLACLYRASAGGDAVEYNVTLRTAAEGLLVAFSSKSRRCVSVTAGKTIGLDPWVRLSYTRMAEVYAQPNWPRAAYDLRRKVTVTATWLLDTSNGAAWQATDERVRGSGPFAAGLDVVYRPLTDGSRPALHEDLLIRVARDPWEAAPPPSCQRSRYAHDMAGMVFLDVWGGRADETERFLQHLAAMTCGRTRFLTVFQNWQTGGFDALLPDSIRMPDYPPNPGIGSIADFQRLARMANRVGRFAMRTNYMLLRQQAPSVREGRAHPALDEGGKPKWHTRPTEWHALAARQEAEIHHLFGTTAAFTDQLTSSAAPWSYLDSNAASPGAGTIDGALQCQRDLASVLRTVHGGPLGSETCMDEHLLGDCVDTGDFGIYDGFHRAFTPEAKLRRIHLRSVFHGMGLMYRYFEMPPFPLFSSGKARYLADPTQYDDYRAAEVLYGNAGYLFYYPGMPWDYVVTECLVVGTLQKHYVLQPVRCVQYWHRGAWRSLLDLMADGIDPQPVAWKPQPDALRRIRVEYRNGLTVVVNRLAEPFTVTANGRMIVLPRSGWVAWKPGDILAFSACWPGTSSRVDFVDAPALGFRYVAPRSATVLGVSRPTAWSHGQVILTLDPATGDAVIRGRPAPWRPIKAKPLEKINFRFGQDLQGWSGISGLGPLRIRDGCLASEIVTDDPALVCPPVNLAPDSVSVIVVRMRVSCGTFGQLYFEAEGSDEPAEQRCIHFAVTPDNLFHDVRIPVSDHALWRGHRITGIRLDPEHGGVGGSVEIESIRGE